MFETVNSEGPKTIAELLGCNTPHQRTSYFVRLHEKIALSLGARDLLLVVGINIFGEYKRATHRRSERDRLVTLTREDVNTRAQRVEPIGQRFDPDLRCFDEIGDSITTSPP